MVLVVAWCTRGDHGSGDVIDAAVSSDSDAAEPGSDAETPTKGPNPVDGDGGAMASSSDTAPGGPAPGGPTPGGPTPSAAVLTQRNDNFRTGAYLSERTLDPAAVRSRGMVLAFGDAVEGEIMHQPLYLPGVMIEGKSRDVVYVATMDNNVYAFDANEALPNNPTAGRKLWQTTLVDPESPASRPLPRGVYATPVIDPAANALYLLHSTRNIPRDSGKLTAQEVAVLNVEFFLVALDLRTGATLRTRKIAGTYPRSDGSAVVFEARNHWCRPALLLSRGSIYLACGMRNDEGSTLFHGWVFRYDASSFSPQGVFCTTPDVTEAGDGASVWQSGSGLAEDPDGNVYFITGNGPADIAHHNYGDALVKLSTAGGSLTVAGAFTSEGPDGLLQRHDVDFGSGGPLVLPDLPYVFGAGKTGIAYVLDRGSMAKRQQFVASVNQYDPTAPVDKFWAGGPHLHGTPAYWRGPDPGVAYVYAWGEQDFLKRHVLDLNTGMFDTSRVKTGKVMGLRETMPGGAVTVSADGNRAGSAIVWATLPGVRSDADPDSRLLAHDAETLEVIWETNFRAMARWMPPTVAGGKVFVATASGRLLIYALGPPK